MYTKEHAEQILPVLKNMRICIEKNDTYISKDQSVDGKNFNLFVRFGICWHVFSHTPDQTIGIDFLDTAFSSLGYDVEYPVEMKMFGDVAKVKEFFKTSDYMCKDQYDRSTEYGKIRCELLNSLIKYFENI